MTGSLGAWFEYRESGPRRDAFSREGRAHDAREGGAGWVGEEAVVWSIAGR